MFLSALGRQFFDVLVFLLNNYANEIFLIFGLVFTVKFYRYLLRPLNRIRKLGDLGLIFDKPGDSDIYKERQIERLKKLRLLGELPPVFPNGWYVVCESSEIKKKQVKQITVFGKFLTLIRSESGNVFITDSYCPHLGANFNIGGRVVRDNCIQCPFHGWIFNAETGKCVDIPYDDGKIPEQAHVLTWPCVEVNETVYIWYHCDQLEPLWDIPVIDEIKSKLWTYCGRTEHEVMAHIQEMPENGADIAHLNYLHKSAPGPEGSNITITNLSLGQPLVQHQWDGKWFVKSEEEAHCGVMHLRQVMTFFGYQIPLSSSCLIAEQLGPGIVHMHFDFGFWGKGIVFQTVTPEEPLLQRVRFRFYSNIPAFFCKFFLTVEANQVFL